MNYKWYLILLLLIFSTSAFAADAVNLKYYDKQDNDYIQHINLYVTYKIDNDIFLYTGISVGANNSIKKTRELFYTLLVIHF